METVDYRDVSFTIWDISGSQKVRHIWKHYYANVKVVVVIKRGSILLSYICHVGVVYLFIVPGQNQGHRITACIYLTCGRPRSACSAFFRSYSNYSLY